MTAFLIADYHNLKTCVEVMPQETVERTISENDYVENDSVSWGIDAPLKRVIDTPFFIFSGKTEYWMFEDSDAFLFKPQLLFEFMSHKNPLLIKKDFELPVFGGTPLSKVTVVNQTFSQQFYNPLPYVFSYNETKVLKTLSLTEKDLTLLNKSILDMFDLTEYPEVVFVKKWILRLHFTTMDSLYYDGISLFEDVDGNLYLSSLQRLKPVKLPEELREKISKELEDVESLEV